MFQKSSTIPTGTYKNHYMESQSGNDLFARMGLISRFLLTCMHDYEGEVLKPVSRTTCRKKSVAAVGYFWGGP